VALRERFGQVGFVLGAPAAIGYALALRAALTV